MPVFDLGVDGRTIEQTADYAATDDATPLSVDDTSGSTGDLTVTYDLRGRPRDHRRLRGKPISVQVTDRAPRSLGKVAHVSGGDSTVSLAIDTVANRLSVKRAAKPYVGTLGGVLRYWVTLVGLSSTDVSVDAAIDGVAVAAVGFYDQVWLRIKQFCAALGVEVAVVDDRLVARAPRALLLREDDLILASSEWDVDTQNTARKVEVAFYDPTEVLPGDHTADFSRSSLPADQADDPMLLNRTAARPQNTLPPGWAGGQVVNS